MEEAKSSISLNHFEQPKRLAILIATKYEIEPSQYTKMLRLNKEFGSNVKFYMVKLGDSFSQTVDLYGNFIITSTAKRLEAKKIGLNYVDSDYVLMLDSDQILDRDLIKEIINSNCDAMVIKEGSSSTKSLFSKILNRQREALINIPETMLTPCVPVIPRLYSTEIIRNAMEAIDINSLTNVVQHEDSLIYLEAYPMIRSLKISKGKILNVDPDIFTFIKKVFSLWVL